MIQTLLQTWRDDGIVALVASGPLLEITADETVVVFSDVEGVTYVTLETPETPTTGATLTRGPRRTWRMRSSLGTGSLASWSNGWPLRR